MKYDFIFLLNEEAEQKNIKDLIEAAGGKLLEEKTWGRKSLAYPIKKLDSAIFYDWKLELEAPKISPLKLKLNFNEKLVRYLLLKED